MVTTQVPIEDAGRYGVVQVGEGGAVTDYVYKPDESSGSDRHQRGVRLLSRSGARPAACPGRRRGGGGAGRPRRPAATGSHPCRARSRLVVAGLLARRRHGAGVLGRAPGLPDRRPTPAPSIHPGGRSTPAGAPMRRPRSPEVRRSTTASWPGAPGWPGRCAGRCCRRGWWSRRAPWWSTRFCCPGYGCGPVPRCSAPSSTTTWSSARERRSVARATSPWWARRQSCPRERGGPRGTLARTGLTGPGGVPTHQRPEAGARLGQPYDEQREEAVWRTLVRLAGRSSSVFGMGFARWARRGS